MAPAATSQPDRLGLGDDHLGCAAERGWDRRGAGQTWARWFAIVVVSLNVFAQLGFLGNSQYPLWALTALTLNIVVLYALTVRCEREPVRSGTRAADALSLARKTCGR